MKPLRSAPVSLSINTLKFLKDNPRVYACTHGHPDFDNLIEAEQQEVIFKKLLEEPSVKNLIPEVKRHGGLMESILIRFDTKEVIEGNSRLAAYRLLHEADPEGDWEYISCDIVSSLTDNQQAAFLNQIHVKGKTRWSAYEKANFAYVRKAKGSNFDEIAQLFGESKHTVRTRTKVIDTMKRNGDNERSHFSYYDVLVRSPDISKGMDERDDLRDFLLGRVHTFERFNDECEADEEGEHHIQLVEPRKDAAESLQSAKEPLHFIAFLILLSVVRPRFTAIALGRHDRSRS